jgi:hypothetical protein
MPVGALRSAFRAVRRLTVGRGAVLVAVGIGVGVAGAGAACLPGGGPALNPYTDDAGGPPPTKLGGDSGASLLDVDLGPPFAVTGLQPSHGPWTGGTRVTISGRGFSSNVTVTIGGTALLASEVFASDPTSISAVTPPGNPGPADVVVTNVGISSVASDGPATLAAGFIYDSFVCSPTSGASTGGTRVALQGKGTQWTAASTVAIGGKPCTPVIFKDATDITCLTPPNDPGSQDVVVTNADGSMDRASDAFVYSDSPDGYRGGLYGGALAGNLTVLGFDAWTGTPLPGVAIAGSSLATAVTASFDQNGVAQLSSPSLTGKVTVTVAAHCHNPVTYVDVPVDTVTVYLNPTLSVACAQGEPPSTGNYFPSDQGIVSGELVWGGGIEFQRAAWGNVPMPANANQHQVAYVFTPTGSPTDAFYLPDESNATTPQSDGQLGYQYKTGGVNPGNVTIYGLAGIQDDSQTPPTFEPFVMGTATGIQVLPGTNTAGVDVPMTTLLNRTLTTVPQPPMGGPQGPDHLTTSLSIALGAGGYAVLPQGTQSALLPFTGDMTFVGVPTLDNSLFGSSYALSASAVTGAGGGDPSSVVQSIQTTDVNDPVTIGGFFDVPTLIVPSSATWTGTYVQLQASGPIDLAVFTVSSGGGLVQWTIVAPGNDLAFDLPDIAQVPNVDSLVHGALVTSFQIARITGFDYGTVTTGQLATSAWNAYAENSASGSY